MIIRRDTTSPHFATRGERGGQFGSGQPTFGPRIEKPRPSLSQLNPPLVLFCERSEATVEFDERE
jgi:hypothetical protein